MARSYKQLYAEIADLQRQLRQAQEERDEAEAMLKTAVEYCNDMIAERHAAIERGVKVFRGYCANAVVIRVLNEALQLVRRDKCAVERDAAEQRALVKELRGAGVTDYSKLTGANRVDCHFCGRVWRTEDPPRHKKSCPLAPAEVLRARSPQGGQEEE